VLTPALRCLGNVICSGLDETASIAGHRPELFAALSKLLSSDHQAVRKECVWVLSNVTGKFSVVLFAC
jgi:HEAT-like repeat